MQAVQRGVQVKVATAVQHAPPEQQADASDVKAMARGLDWVWSTATSFNVQGIASTIQCSNAKICKCIDWAS